MGGLVKKQEPSTAELQKYGPGFLVNGRVLVVVIRLNVGAPPVLHGQLARRVGQSSTEQLRAKNSFSSLGE